MEDPDSNDMFVGANDSLLVHMGCMSGKEVKKAKALISMM